MTASVPLRCGLLGPGRSRNGLGPYLARWLERAGMRVVAGAGRDLARTRAACDFLSGDLGHEVVPRAGLRALLEPGDLDALVIASPATSHLEALRAALDARVHVLCEKPLVPSAQLAAVGEITERFVQAGRVLIENCQWPETLAAFDALYPGARSGPPRAFAMRLSPSQPGLPMLEDSLSHYLSVLQALAPIGPMTRLTRCVFSAPPTPDCEHLVVDLEFAGPFEPIAGRFELQRCASQPRPAWYEIDRRRLDRQIRTEDYAFFAVGSDGDRRVPMDDPLGQLVYRFALTVREPCHDRIQREARSIAERARLFRSVLTEWGAA